jgi:hypothetical protein
MQEGRQGKYKYGRVTTSERSNWYYSGFREMRYSLHPESHVPRLTASES